MELNVLLAVIRNLRVMIEKTNNSYSENIPFVIVDTGNIFGPYRAWFEPGNPEGISCSKEMCDIFNFKILYSGKISNVKEYDAILGAVNISNNTNRFNSDFLEDALNEANQELVI